MRLRHTFLISVQSSGGQGRSVLAKRLSLRREPVFANRQCLVCGKFYFKALVWSNQTDWTGKLQMHDYRIMMTIISVFLMIKVPPLKPSHMKLITWRRWNTEVCVPGCRSSRAFCEVGFKHCICPSRWTDCSFSLSEGCGFSWGFIPACRCTRAL